MKLLDFWAPWCQPCKIMNPIIDSLAKEFNVEKINVDNDDYQIQEKHGIMSIPTYVIINDKEEEVQRFTGVTPVNTLRNALVAQ